MEGRAVFAKTFKGDFSRSSIHHIAEYQFEILRRNMLKANFFIYLKLIQVFNHKICSKKKNKKEIRKKLLKNVTGE